jgi:uncharacterized protein (TIGR02996 family)
VVKHLVEADAALEDGDDHAALSSLLAAWRATPAPAIADSVDELSTRLAAKATPIRAVGSTSATKAWHALADEQRAGALGRLLEVLPEGQDRCERLDRIIALDRDPRITPFARKWFATPPVHGARRVPFFTRLIALLDKTRDVRLLPVLEEITSSSRRTFTIHRLGLKSWKPLVALTESLAATKTPSLDEEAERALERIQSRLSSSAATNTAAVDAASLFAKVYADPTDDEARAVLSDLLQQQGDPRGEFIALQLARHGTGKPRSARERALESAWARDWLGEIEPAVMKGDVVFERGFVTRCRYAGGSAGEKVTTAEEWSTVVHLDVSISGFIGGSLEFLQEPVARRSIRHVVGLGHEDMQKLPLANELPWETLGMRVWRWSEAALLAGPGKAFPHVRKLVLAYAQQGIIADASAQGVEELIERWPNVIELEIQAAAPLLAELARSVRAKRLKRLEVQAGGVDYVLDRTTKCLRVSLRTVNAYTARNAAEALGGGLAAAAAADVDRVTVVATGRVTQDGDMLTRGREQVSLAPLRASAEAAGLGFELVLE